MLVSEDVRELTLADFSTASVASAGQRSEGRVSIICKIEHKVYFI